MGKRQNQGRRCYIVQEFLFGIKDNIERLVCYLYMKKYSDKQVCKQLNIAQKKLNLIKYKLALELRFAGINY